MPKERKQVDKNGKVLNCCVTCQSNYAKRGEYQCKACVSKGLDPEKDKAKWVLFSEARKKQGLLAFE